MIVDGKATQCREEKFLYLKDRSGVYFYPDISNRTKRYFVGQVAIRASDVMSASGSGTGGPNPRRGNNSPSRSLGLHLSSVPTQQLLPEMPKTQIKFPDLPMPAPSGTEILRRERSKATFDSDELARYIHGDEYLERQQRLLRILENEPLFDKSNVYYQGRDARFRESMAKAKRMVQVRASAFPLPRRSVNC